MILNKKKKHTLQVDYSLSNSYQMYKLAPGKGCKGMKLKLMYAVAAL